MTSLRMIVDDLVGDHPRGTRRYTEELTRQLIATAPAGCDVEGIVSAVSEEQLAGVRDRLPGLASVTQLPLGRRELALAWQSGLPVGGPPGMLHAPTLLAPLRRHDHRDTTQQLAVTIHDTLAWTHPSALGPTATAWTRAMAGRARRFADAVVVPTHAVAHRLSERFDFGDRVRVIGGAPATALRLPADDDERAERLGLPEAYALTLGTIEPRKGVADLIRAVARPEAEDIPLLIVGADRLGETSASGVAAASGLPEGRVRTLGRLEDADYAVVFDRATMFVFPSLAEGFGLPVVEAFKFGLPVIHSDDAALVEVAGGAGLAVERPSGNADRGYPERLAMAIGRLLHDAELQARLRVLASDRARAFSWRDSAERVWQLHADL